MSSKVIFDFKTNSDLQNWIVVDDIVMGGRSSGNFILDDDGFGVFKGKISLENNGGFSSVRYRSGKIEIDSYTKIIIKLKGDGKDFQFRLKCNSNDYYTYISKFSTSGEWQEIEILLKDMYPSFRGRKLDLPNFSGAYFEEVAFLVGNKREESFKLLIDKIELK